jgi:hypothetical protein
MDMAGRLDRKNVRNVVVYCFRACIRVYTVFVNMCDGQIISNETNPLLILYY